MNDTYLIFIAFFLLGAFLGFMVVLDVIVDRVTYKKPEFKTKWQLLKWILQPPKKEKKE